MKPLKGAAMLYTLVVITVMALLCSAMISLSRFRSEMFRRDQSAVDKIQLCQAAFNVFQSETGNFDLHIPIGSNDQDTLQIHRGPWGLYDILGVYFSSDTSGMQALIGRVPDSIGHTALYLTDISSPLSMAGKAVLTGPVLLPQGGVQPGYVNTIGFSGTQLTTSRPGISRHQLPVIDKHWQGHLEKLIQGTPTQKNLPQTIRNSFNDPLLHLHRKNLVVSKVAWKGHIILSADSTIRIASDARLEDVIIVAPRVYIDPGFDGSVQIFAQHYIETGANVHLTYPSVLAVSGKSDNQKKAAILLKQHSSVFGAVLLAPTTSQPGEPAIVEIEKNALVHGELYVDGWLALQGTVHGHVACNQFLLQTSTSRYINFMYDAEIDLYKRTRAYLSPMLFSTNLPCQPLKWIP